MTDELDGGSANGTDGSPKPVGSQQSDSTGSFDAAKLQKTLDALVKKQDEIDARTRALQGDKDRGVNQTRKELDEIKRMFAGVEKLKGSGLELDDAVEEYDFRETVRQLKGQLEKLAPASQQATGTSPAGVTEAAKSVFEKARVDPNSPEAVALLREHGHDPIELAMQVGLLRAKMGTQSTATTSAPSISAGAPQPADLKTLTDNYIKDMRANAGPGKAALRNEIKNKAIKAGVDIHKIDFS